MRLRNAIALLPLLGGCFESSTTEPALEQRVFNILGGLEIGEALQAEGPSAETIFLTGGREGSTYLYVPFWATSEEGTKTLSVEVTGTNLQGGGNNALSPARNPLSTRLGGPDDPRLSFEFHDRLRRSERLLEGLIPSARAQHQRARRNGPASAAVPQVGDTLTINANPNQACTNPSNRRGRVAAVTDRTVIVTDIANPASSFSEADYRSVGLTFDTLIYRVNTRVFGEPTDIDQNGRVIIFYTRAVNELTPPGSRGQVGGFFFVRDLFPRQGCAASNVAEIFYLLAPDPTGVVNGNRVTEARVRSNTVGVTAHEFEHLINASRRIYVNNAQELEEAWLDEGLAHIAEELIFYETSGLRPRQNIGFSQIVASQAIINAFVAYMNGNLGRYELYMTNPSEESLMGVDTELETRGAAWSFLRYVADQRNANDEALFRQLVNARIAGVANLRNVLGTDPVDLMQDWTVSVYTDDFVPRVPGIYTQPSWNWRDLYAGFEEPFPLKVLTVANNSPTQVELKGGGAAFLEISPVGERSAAIGIRADSRTPSDSLRVSVVRVR